MFFSGARKKQAKQLNWAVGQYNGDGRATPVTITNSKRPGEGRSVFVDLLFCEQLYKAERSLRCVRERSVRCNLRDKLSIKQSGDRMCLELGFCGRKENTDF